MTEKPEGYQEHHRKKRRSKDERPVNKLYVSAELHDWIEKHPEEARALGWSVKQTEDPADVVVVIPDMPLPKERKPRTKIENPKERTVTQIKTPKDEENTLPELMDACQERLEKLGMEWKHENKRDARYYVLVAVLADWLAAA